MNTYHNKFYLPAVDRTLHVNPPWALLSLDLSSREAPPSILIG